MPRRVLTLALLVLALAAPASADAAVFRLTSAKVAECKGSDPGETRSATFTGRMRALARTGRMAMRFTLMERFGDEKLHAVDFSELRAWRFSKPGVKDFRFRQTVTALQRGGEYRVRIDFRWLDSDDNLLRRSQRISGPCRMPGELANLFALAPSALTGPEGTEVYVVPVRNGGKVAAEDVAVELSLDGATTNVGHIDSIAPGETREVRFTGPPCKRLRIVVDPADSVKERRESDNVTSVRCPAPAP